MWKAAAEGAVGGAVAGGIAGATVDTGGVAGAIFFGAVAGGAGEYSEQVTGNLLDGGRMDSFYNVKGEKIAGSAIAGGLLGGAGKFVSKILGKFGLANKGLTKLNSAKLQAGKVAKKTGGLFNKARSSTLNSLHATGKEFVNGSEKVGAKVVAPTISAIAVNVAGSDWASNFGSGGSGDDSSGGNDSESDGDDDSNDSNDSDEDNDND